MDDASYVFIFHSSSCCFCGSNLHDFFKKKRIEKRVCAKNGTDRNACMRILQRSHRYGCKVLLQMWYANKEYAMLLRQILITLSSVETKIVQHKRGSTDFWVLPLLT